MSNLEYDDDWRITLNNNSNNPYSDLGDHYGAFTGNGKIAVYSSMSDISINKTLISGNVQYNQIGKYNNNTLEVFSANNIHFGYNDAITYEMIQQSLDMSTSEVNTTINVKYNSDIIAEVQNNVIPLRQYPYCVLQTVNFTLTEDTNILDIYHEVKSCKGITEESYNNNVIYNEQIYEDKGLYVFTATGKVAGTTVGVGTSYFFDPTLNEVQNLGYNIFNDKSKAYQKFRMKNLVAGVVYKFYILSATMTSHDFEDPLEEVKRILLNIAFKEESTTVLVTKLLEDNSALWNEMWKGDIEIIPKASITNEERDRVKRIKMFLRLSLFNVFSCLRDAVNTEINPLNLSYIDTNGNVFFDGDLWLIPSLIFLKPQIARVMLEFKYRIMEQALQLSASFGYKGSKFPYKNDITGYKNVYWDVISPLHIFNNANICVNVWNYYRVTLDKDWLSSKGYIMMKNIVDFLVSFMTFDGLIYTVPKTLGLGEIMSINNAFTINTILHAVKYTIEASYVLGLIPNRKWLDILLKLQIPTITSGENIDVIKYDSFYDGTTDVDILDNLVTLIPYYSSMYFNDYSVRNNSAILRNINYYSDKIKAGYDTNVLNNMIQTSLYGVLAQTSISYMSSFYNKLDKIFTDNVRGYWGHLNLKNDTRLGNDVSLNGFFVLIILNCICGLEIRGSTAPSNVIIEAFRIQDKLGVYMPNTWLCINIPAVGNDGVFLNVNNQLPYTIEN